MNNKKENLESAGSTENSVIDNDLETQEFEEFEEVEVSEPLKEPARRILIFSVSGIVLTAIIGSAAWFFLIKGEEENAVPVPRNISFGDSDSGKNLFAGEQKITLTDDQLRSLKLKIVEIGETLDAVAMNETTTGVIRANEYEKTPIVSQVGGVVKSLNAELGRFVRRGQTIAIVASEELARVQSKYLSIKAELTEADRRYKRALSLSEISEESRNELDRQTADVKAAGARLTETKSDHERSGKLVKTGAVSRREFEEKTAKLRVTEANHAEAKSRLERAKKLLKINPARNNEIDKFLTAVRNKQSELASVRERLLVLGLPKDKVNSLNSPGQISSNLPIPSPVSGTITERLANVNEIVSMNSKIAEVTDLSTIWVIGQVYEKDLGKLRIGSGASITSDAYPGELFRGTDLVH